MTRQERIEANEAVFRKYAARRGETIRFYCECVRDDCQESVAVAWSDYEVIRAEPGRFLVVPGHETPEAERVLSRTARYYIVALRA